MEVLQQWKLLPLTTIFLILHLLSSTLTNASGSNYSRPLPRPDIFTPRLRADSEPEQVHISLAGDFHIRITWITEDKKALSIVEYGTASGDYSSVESGDHTSYRYFLYTSGKIHRVKIGPLEPDTTYYYRCGGSGPEFSFKTPPSFFPIEFAVVGDLGQTEWTKSTLMHVDSTDYDVFLLPGDLSYADSKQPVWDSFGRFVEPHASRRPWMVTEGNHEREVFPVIYPHGFMAYNARWHMPHLESGSYSNLYYSFDVAGVHVLMLGSYDGFHSQSDQHKWIKADLEKVDRVRTPWLVAVMHTPWYNSNPDHQGDGEDMRKAIEKILFKARVDIIFAGHVHAYERFDRVYRLRANQCGPVHVTIGDGGNREGLAPPFNEHVSRHSLFRESSFGHGRLRVVNETHAHWTWHRNDDSDSVVADEVWLESLSSNVKCVMRRLDDQ